MKKYGLLLCCMLMSLSYAQEKGELFSPQKKILTAQSVVILADNVDLSLEADAGKTIRYETNLIRKENLSLVVSAGVLRVQTRNTENAFLHIKIPQQLLTSVQITVSDGSIRLHNIDAVWIQLLANRTSVSINGTYKSFSLTHADSHLYANVKVRNSAVFCLNNVNADISLLTFSDGSYHIDYTSMDSSFMINGKKLTRGQYGTQASRHRAIINANASTVHVSTE